MKVKAIVMDVTEKYLAKLGVTGFDNSGVVATVGKRSGEGKLFKAIIPAVCNAEGYGRTEDEAIEQLRMSLGNTLRPDRPGAVDGKVVEFEL